jgi:hypothetical protein
MLGLEYNLEELLWLVWMYVVAYPVAVRTLSSGLHDSLQRIV